MLRQKRPQYIALIFLPQFSAPQRYLFAQDWRWDIQGKEFSRLPWCQRETPSELCDKLQIEHGEIAVHFSLLAPEFYI